MQERQSFKRPKYLKPTESNVPELIKRADSKNALSTFSFSKESATVYPDFDFEILQQLIDSDPVARGAYTTYIDAFMEGDYAVLKKKDLTYDREFEQKLDDEYNFRHDVIRAYAIVGKLSKNVFLEIVRKSDGSVKQLNVLDSNSIEPITKPNGDVVGYTSRIPDPLTGKKPTWTADEIVWYKLEDRKKGYATVDLKTLYNTLLAKSYVTKYIAWLFKTGQYRIMYNFKTASDTDIENFLAYARRHVENFDAPIITKGEMEVKVLRDMKEVGDLTALVKHYNSEILIAMRIPPIDAGIPDASGRSNADAQSNSLSAHLTSMKKVFEDVTNKELFPRMNKGNNIIRFGPNNRFEEKQIFDNIKSLKSVNVSEDFIREYLRDRGMFYATEEIFEEPQEEMLGVKNQDGDPSRQPEPDKEVSGGSEGSTTRPDQVSS